MQEMMQTKSVKAVIVWVLFYSIGPLYAASPWLHVEGNRIKDPKSNVVVLRGVSLIDLGFLEDWQGGAIDMIDRLTDKNDPQGNSPGWYPKVIRIPVVPSDAVDNWPHPFTPGDDKFYNDLLRPVVDYCASKDLYVIIDWHYVADTWDKVDQTNEFWEYMAPRFADDSHVIFELFNEPINDVNNDWIGNAVNDWLSVRADMQTWVDIVRSYAPNNLILVAGAFYSQIIGPAADYLLTGDNIVIVSHIYPGHWLDDNWSWWYVNQMTTCAAVHPVIMTEWGFTTTSETLLNGTITGYGRPLMDFIEGLGIGNTAWVASYDWGPPIFNRDWTLRVGEGEMGGFVKDMLYLRRNDDQPYGPVQTPYGELAHVIPGTIEAEDYDVGGQDVAYYDSNSGNVGGEYRSDDVDIEICSEGGYNISDIEDGEWLEYTVDVNLPGFYEIEVRVASASVGGNFHIEFDDKDMTGPITFTGTGDEQSWTSIYANNVVLESGQYIMRLAMDSNDWKINWIKFTRTDGGTGIILREWWTGISGSAVSDLTSNVNYPNNPNGSEQLRLLEGPSNCADNYRTRFRGYVHPVTSGDYTFWIASNNNSELWLSTDSNPANVSLIASVSHFTVPRQWDRYPGQQSSLISLTAGQKYYIEVLHKENAGSDNIAVAWQRPGLSQQVIEGVYLSPWIGG